jgi:hypothetical protein
MSGVLGTTRRTGFALAISRLCAGNPALPQSVPASVLLNFFMPAAIVDGVSLLAMGAVGNEPRLAGGKGRPAFSRLVVVLLKPVPARVSTLGTSLGVNCKFDPNEIWANYRSDRRLVVD